MAQTRMRFAVALAAMLLLLGSAAAKAQEEPPPEPCLPCIEAVASEELPWSDGGEDPGMMGGGELDLSVIPGYQTPLVSRLPPEPPLAGDYSSARCWSCLVEGWALEAALVGACVPRSPWFSPPACLAAVAAMAEWYQRCRGTCNRSNYR